MSEDARRPLTQGERTLGTATFGPLALERVRLCAGPGLNPFADATLEPQAQMVEHYEGGADRTPLDRHLAGSGLYRFQG